MAAIGGSFLTNPLYQIIGYGAGAAMGPALRPVIQDLINEAWTLHPVRPPSAETLAGGVAQGQVDLGWATDRAAEQGISGDAFNRLVDIANVGPGLAQAYRLWRRGTISEAGFRRALRRAGIEDEWIDDLVRAKNERLEPALIAVMVQRGIIPDPGYLPVGPPTGGGRVPPMPVAALDANLEAEAAGLTSERMAALTRIVGLPASPDLAARMTFRNIIDRIDFDRAIAEGNTRNEWADVLFEGFRQIPSAHDFIEGELRGWLTPAQRHNGTQLHGMKDADSDLLFKITGRPPSTRQVFIGQRRGGVYDGPTGGIDPAILKQLRESNIRPEWINLMDAQKETYPSAFVLRALAQGGDIDPPTTRRLLEGLGWPQFLVDAVVVAWTGTAEGVDESLVKSARTQAITEIRNAFLIGQADESQARGWLEGVGVTSLTVDALLPIWRVMLEVPQKGLTAPQIVKAYHNLSDQWPRSRALDELQLLGLTADDAATLLDE